MTIPLTSRIRTPKGRPHTLIREPTFYQEAYLASSSYVQAIGNQLKRDWGFRSIEADDVANLSAFSTVLTSSYIRITEDTLSIGPLRDLISFLQCLLPSSNALSLAPSSSATSSFAIGRCLGTSEGDADLVDRQREDRQIEETKGLMIDSWRGAVVECTGQDEPQAISTPCTTWLDKNEDMLRDTVGCGYYRRLREVAEDQKEVGPEVQVGVNVKIVEI
uniref:Uncharacterized protein n=1 Tax=Kwoniella dejecticola CBS 10117 TaxID=1296121 RepID=A0A1A6AGJ1_9TREE|nr:uncharacterized protein I303_01000 [Kwoniella dejecticola CBS 10117]OBR89177.1 hypothetical protein I303_01000 [Kwoniella dejecticola CBS 10117]